MNIDFSVIIWILIIGLIIFVVHKIMSKFKMPKIGALCLISGGVKTGKSTLGVALSIAEHNRSVRRWKIRCWLCSMLDRKKPEEPLLYSNIPLTVPYVPVTEDLLLRKKRFRYGSTIYICEASLVADSQMFREMELNDRLLLFNKLIGHSTKGGRIIYDTQQIGDVHISIKRSLSEYMYIHHLVKWIPFFLVAYIREERYSNDGTTVNSYVADVEESLKKVLIKKSTWKKFDCYCYSCLTDDLPVEDNVIKSTDLKARTIVSFKDWGKYQDNYQDSVKNDLAVSYSDLSAEGVKEDEKKND